MRHRSLTGTIESITLIWTATLLVILAASIFTGVVTRYILKISVPELALIQRFCVFWLVFAGGALAVRTDDHLAIDVFGPFLHDRGLRRQRIAIDVLTTVAVVFFMVVGYNGFLAGLNRTELLRISWINNVRISLVVFNSAFLVGALLMVLFHTVNLVNRYGPKHSEKRDVPSGGVEIQ